MIRPRSAALLFFLPKDLSIRDDRNDSAAETHEIRGHRKRYVVDYFKHFKCDFDFSPIGGEISMKIDDKKTRR